jgi:Ni/Co efflux regulator RcnB
MRFSRNSKQAAAAAAISFCAAMAVAQPAAAPADAQPSAASRMGYGVKLGGFFNDQHKQVARKYFSQRYAKAKDCPQGMEREGKACKTPVAGRYWAVGQPLQKAVATYPVPDPLVAQLPPAPQGYEYVRAGDDILLVSKGGMHLVVDIIENVMG